MIGESLEQHCSVEFNRIRSLFKNAYFEKDNDCRNGSKGDFIFRDFDDDGMEHLQSLYYKTHYLFLIKKLKPHTHTFSLFYLSLLSSENNLRLANNKAMDLTIKKLTTDSPTLIEKFNENINILIFYNFKLFFIF